MPRHPKRPTPNPYQLSKPPDDVLLQFPEDLPLEFWRAVVEGLLRRLEKARKEQWVRRNLHGLAWDFVRWTGYGRLSNEDAERRLIRELATARRSREKCDPNILLEEYEVAARVLRKGSPFVRRWRNPSAKDKAVEEAARSVFTAVTATTEDISWQGVTEKVVRPRLCNHAYRTDLPPDFGKRVRGLRTERELIEYVLAWVHRSTPGSVRHRLDEGARIIRRARRRGTEALSS